MAYKAKDDDPSIYCHTLSMVFPVASSNKVKNHISPYDKENSQDLWSEIDYSLQTFIFSEGEHLVCKVLFLVIDGQMCAILSADLDFLCRACQEVSYCIDTTAVVLLTCYM